MNPETTALVLIEFQNDFTTEGGVLHGAVQDVMESTDMLAHAQGRPRGHPRRGRHGHPQPDRVRGRLRRDHRPPVRDPQGRRRLERVREGLVGRRVRRGRRPGRERHRHRGQARTGRLRVDQPRLHPALQGHHDRGARGLPDQLLRRVDHAFGLREGLRGHHADRRRRRDLPGRARQRDHVRLPDVLQADDGRRVRLRPARRTRGAPTPRAATEPTRARLGHATEPPPGRSTLPSSAGALTG